MYIYPGRSYNIVLPLVSFGLPRTNPRVLLVTVSLSKNLPPSDRPQLPRLRRLAICDSSEDMQIEDVRRMCMRWFPSVVELMISLSSGWPLHDQSEWPGPLRVYVPGYMTAAIDFGTADVDEFSVKVWRRFDQGCVPILSSERLVRLFVHEHEVSRYGPLPSAPNLVDLCIVLASCAETRRTRMRLAGLFADTQLVFEYPALRTLRFAHLDVPPMDPCGSRSSYCTCKSGSTIALSDISDFIRSRLPLQPPGRRLDTLILSCIRDIVDVDLAQALRTLHTLVEGVTFEPSLPQYLLRPVYPFLSSSDGVRLTNIFDSDTVSRSLSDIDYEDWEIYGRPRR
ncbi:hypothetical protein EXIGLDRAFT_462413 [Exidia glandulosa HHB12029]|uniref:Uncharacterized protein n=1 Tax=Exidia glandulosa HHB12029 TaxID=1314781 RepID=A0A166AW62_EXIGL|nr:hypothetical protein EXIGLDRAFT_462413 [Exidia glandulosa HHB12029]